MGSGSSRLQIRRCSRLNLETFACPLLTGYSPSRVFDAEFLERGRWACGQQRCEQDSFITLTGPLLYFSVVGSKCTSVAGTLPLYSISFDCVPTDPVCQQTCCGGDQWFIIYLFSSGTVICSQTATCQMQSIKLS